MKNVILTVLSFVLLGVLIVSMVDANDKEFALNYAQTHKLNPEHVRAVNSESECKDNEWFESNWGLCVYDPITDSDVEGL